MKKNEFIKEIVEYCELEGSGIQMNTEFRSIEGYDSMAVLSLIAFADEKFGIRLTSKQIYSLTDLESYVTLIGKNKFDDE